MILISRLLLVLFLASIPALTAASDRIAEMLSFGQTLAVVRDSNAGHVVYAIGRTPATGTENRDRELARTYAYEELAGFLKGRRVKANDRVRVELKGDQLEQSFFSSIETQVDAMLRAVEVDRTGRYSDDFYVVLKVSSRVAEISRKLSASLGSDEVTATGVASLQPGLERARRIALEDAQRNAVAQFSGVASVSRSSVTDGTEVRSRTSARSKGFVSSYRVIDERAENGFFTIRIVAKVREGDNRSNETVQAVLDNVGRPTFFVQTDHSEAKRQMEALLRKSKLDVASGASAARFIVKIEINPEEFRSIGGMTGRRTSLSLRLLDRMSSEQLEVVAGDPSDTLEVSDSPTIREQRSLELALEGTVPQFLKAVTARITDQFDNGSRVSVKLAGFERMRTVDLFRELLEDIPGVRSVHLKPLQEAVADFDVFYSGDPAELQMLALRSAERFRLYGLRLRRSSGEGIQFTVGNK